MNHQLRISNRSIFAFLNKLEPILSILKSMADQSISVFCVGGACRDILLSRDVFDLDLEVYNCSLDTLERILKNFTKTCSVGNRFLVVKTPAFNCDWALARLDGEGRLPEVKALETKNLSVVELYKRAAIRRDLRINSIGLDLSKIYQSFDRLKRMAQSSDKIDWLEKLEIQDPFAGLADLEAKTLRAVDQEFFTQDPLRLFRVAQFYSRLEFAPDEELTQICKTMPVELDNSSDKYFCPYERIGEEFNKLLGAKRPSLGLTWLMSLGRWKSLVRGLEHFQDNPELFGQTIAKLDQIADLIASPELAKYSRQGDMHFYSLAILVAKAQNPELFLRETRLDKQSVAKIIKLLKMQSLLLETLAIQDKNANDFQLKLLAKHAWPELSLCQVVLFTIFDCLDNKKQAELSTFGRLKSLGIIDRPIEPLVDGNDIMSLGIMGKEVKTTLDKAYRLQIENNIEDKILLIEKLKNNI